MTIENEFVSYGNGFDMSPISHLMLSNVFIFWRCFACSIIAGVMSIPVACLQILANSTVSEPVPEATSSTTSFSCGRTNRVDLLKHFSDMLTRFFRKRYCLLRKLVDN